MQRAVDQLIHDVALQNLPVVFILDRSGFVGDDGETHQGLFDIALFRPVPNMTILAPAAEAELKAMLDWSLSRPGPCLIRYPKASCPPHDEAFSGPLELGRGAFIRRNAAVPDKDPSLCLAFTGGLYPQVLEAAEILASRNIPADLYNLRFLKPIDEAYLLDLMNRYDLVVFIEEGLKSGGFGEYGVELGTAHTCGAQTLALGAGDSFASLGTRDELLEFSGLDGPGIARSVGHAYGRLRGVSFPQAAAP
jgi:1-deoxy-D-xylulose-5-phosphate synthase